MTHSPFTLVPFANDVCCTVVFQWSAEEERAPGWSCRDLEWMNANQAFLGACILAVKFVDDHPPWNGDWRKVVLRKG